MAKELDSDRKEAERSKQGPAEDWEVSEGFRRLREERERQFPVHRPGMPYRSKLYKE